MASVIIYWSLLTQHLISCSWEFHQICNLAAVGHKDKQIDLRSVGQGQGHSKTTYGHIRLGTRRPFLTYLQNAWMYHTVLGCFKDDSASQCNSMEKGEMWPPTVPTIPKPMTTTFGIGDEVRDLYLCAKFYHDLIEFSFPAPSAPMLGRVCIKWLGYLIFWGVLPLL